MPSVSPTRVPDGRRALLAGRAVARAGGLLGALGAVPGRRRARGRRYGLASVLGLWFAGVLAGQQTFTAVWEWAVDLPAELLAGFGLTRGIPSERTTRRLVEGCDPVALDEALSGWIARAATVGDPGPRGLAFDGKTLKGTRSFTEAGAMSQEAVLEAVWHDTGITAGHQRVVGGDEIAALEALAGRLDLTDVLVTTAEKGHGRVEVRSLKALTVTTPKLVGFWGTKQVIELRRRTRRKKTVTAAPTVSEEVFYLVTSLPAEQAHPRDLAARARARGHWTVEAIHHVRDRVLDEDRHTARTANAPLAWAIARDTAISALRLTGHRSIAKALRTTARQPERVLQTIALISEKGL
ncbi:transposase, IS4 family protein [Parafrankia sp. EAN1pec]|uniref:transposase family protein n=1 Tax=Parafrankia sp. (strain EAN1pec) TaxID=298653 RepID=UPI0000544028|nr:transposase, IS4 family protein [Frankia sp. EAN1pec]